MSEKIRTQAKLLATTRRDGWEATALDTGNTFKYVAPVGWTPLVPMDGLVGQPLVVAEDRGISSFDTRNRLVPEDREPGQLVAVDQFSETSLAFRDRPSGITYPLNFAPGGTLNFVNRVIPAGALGPNGFLRVSAFGAVITNASKTITFAITTPSLVNGLDMTLASNANFWAFEYSFLMQNTNDETAQTATNSLKRALYLSGATTSSSWDENFQSGFTASGVDTTADWVLNGQITTAAITGAAEVTGCVVEYGYAA